MVLFSEAPFTPAATRGRAPIISPTLARGVGITRVMDTLRILEGEGDYSYSITASLYLGRASR